VTRQRIEPLTAPFSAQLQESFDVVMPPGMPPLNIFRTVGHNQRVLSRMVRGGLLDRGSLTLAQRELVILRACALCGAEYEWGVHVSAFAEKAGFSERQIAASCTGDIDATFWSAEQTALLALVDELHTTAQVTDETWENLSAYFTNEQLIELVMLAGLYHAVSFIANSLRLDHEDFAPGFPVAENTLRRR
jgi:alkylhydroperoxidase family enzyme